MVLAPDPVVPKVKAVGVAGSASTLLVFLADLAGLELPPTVAAAVVVVVAFLGGYVKKS
ncbi:MAG: hypothetical protein H0W36_12915 [Gemmatimonadetes bacterium]|nr:hypothetical protein [Gemmatimonadota bacterium]